MFTTDDYIMFNLIQFLISLPGSDMNEWHVNCYIYQIELSTTVLLLIILCRIVQKAIKRVYWFDDTNY